MSYGYLLSTSILIAKIRLLIVSVSNWNSHSSRYCLIRVSSPGMRLLRSRRTHPRKRERLSSGVSKPSGLFLDGTVRVSGRCENESRPYERHRQEQNKTTDSRETHYHGNYPRNRREIPASTAGFRKIQTAHVRVALAAHSLQEKCTRPRERNKRSVRCAFKFRTSGLSFAYRRIIIPNIGARDARASRKDHHRILSRRGSHDDERKKSPAHPAR